VLYVDPIAQRFDAAHAAPGSKGREKVAARELEHFFLYTLLKQMRSSMTEGGLFEKSRATKIYDDLLDDALAKHMADSGQMGLAQLLEAQLHQQKLRANLVKSNTAEMTASLLK